MKLGELKFSQLKKVFSKYEAEVLSFEYFAKCLEIGEIKPLDIREFIDPKTTRLAPFMIIPALIFLTEKGYFNRVNKPVKGLIEPSELLLKELEIEGV